MLALILNAVPGTARASVLAPRSAPQATAASAPTFTVVPAAVGAFNHQGDCCDLPLALEATLAG
jgi:hypothetical protein